MASARTLIAARRHAKARSAAEPDPANTFAGAMVQPGPLRRADPEEGPTPTVVLSYFIAFAPPPERLRRQRKRNRSVEEIEMPEKQAG